MINCESSLADFQAHNSVIYLVVNDRYYSIEQLFARVHRHVTQVLKAVRKKQHRDIDYHLCMAFSWTFAILNRFHVDLDQWMWKCFPGLCPYCSSAPCDCKQRPPERQRMLGKARGKKPVKLRDWQKMFAEIYPNVVQDSAIHLAEEAGEVQEALQAHSATHQDKWFSKAIEELVDVVTNIFGVANCLHINMSDFMAMYFATGCPGCKQLPCACGFVVAG